MVKSTRDPYSPCLLRVAPDGGVPFYDWLSDRCSGTQQLQRLAAFIQEWGVLEDEYQGDAHWGPTIEDYALRFNRPTATSYRLRTEFGKVIPGERDPSRINRLLWSAMPVWTAEGPFRPVPLLGVRVAEREREDLAEEAAATLRELVPGFTWRDDESAVLHVGENKFPIALAYRISVREDGTPRDVAGWFLEIHKTGLPNLDTFDPVQFPSAPDAPRELIGQAAVRALLERWTGALVDVATGGAA